VGNPHVNKGDDILRSARLCLAPLAGYTDAPFRLICSGYGADFAVTEMVSADGLVRRMPKTSMMLRRMEREGPVGVQLFGSDPSVLAEAAAIAEEEATFIDLNFGCPVKKVVRRNGGAAVMRDLGLMERICSAVVRAVRVPVTTKIRSGWTRRDENYIDAGRTAEDAGLSAVTLHPRYRAQGFEGEADWTHIARLREALSIPVIANGDVRSVSDYERIVSEAGPGTVMIGRGALGRPWIFAEIKSLLEGSSGIEFGLHELVALIKRHVRIAIDWKGERKALLEMRKHYRWYLRGISGIKKCRTVLSRAESPGDVYAILDSIKGEHTEIWKKPA
jgi:tRNA-dihydrouridine synthase B